MRTRSARRRQQQQRYSDDFNYAANQNEPVEAYRGFQPKSEKQQLQADLIDANDFVFSIGPAGTGKTHVAMAKAVEALQSGKVETILLARPAVEAGKTLGFLPGDQNEKMAPYMRPLYDELDRIYGRSVRETMVRDGVVEVAPVGTMRGRTFKNAFVIVDEAQNMLPAELKMALTRLGEGSKMVITGDPEQVDLTPKDASGLMPLVEQLKGIEGVAVQYYGPEDVMRHPTVQRIVDRMEGKEPQKQVVSKPSIPWTDSPRH
jgi:phosphate starvation-inducible protein PhoH and related proteins